MIQNISLIAVDKKQEDQQQIKKQEQQVWKSKDLPCKKQG